MAKGITEEEARKAADCLEDTFTDMHEEPFKSIFKKSEHDEIMGELEEIRKKLDRLDRPYEIPIIPYPYPCPYLTNPYPYIPYDSCEPRKDRVWVMNIVDTVAGGGYHRYGCYTI